MFSKERKKWVWQMRVYIKSILIIPRFFWLFTQFNIPIWFLISFKWWWNSIIFLMLQVYWNENILYTVYLSQLTLFFILFHFNDFTSFLFRKQFHFFSFNLIVNFFYFLDLKILIFLFVQKKKDVVLIQTRVTLLQIRSTTFIYLKSIICSPNSIFIHFLSIFRDQHS